MKYFIIYYIFSYLVMLGYLIPKEPLIFTKYAWIHLLINTILVLLAPITLPFLIGRFLYKHS